MELREGDYFGTALNRAARVMAVGHGGQLLLADSTAVLVSGVDMLDLGRRRLRDLPTPVGVFQVRAEGLPTEFLPLRALDTSPGNLRPAATSLIGRESELVEVTAALRDRRLVTLTGFGGVGKTRLGVEVAAHLAREFQDGVWVFELAAVTDPAAVPDAVAAVLGELNAVRRASTRRIHTSRWSRSASSSCASSANEILPTRRRSRSAAIDLICSACAFESTASPVVLADNNT